MGSLREDVLESNFEPVLVNVLQGAINLYKDEKRKIGCGDIDEHIVKVMDNVMGKCWPPPHT